MSTSSEANSNQEPVKRTDGPTSPSPPTAQSLVGVWRAEVNEDGERSTITVTFLANGDSRYLIKNEKGETGTDTGTWQYSDETIFERFSNGSSGRASIRWIDQDTLELTIIDNGVPSYTGLKRLYRRVT